MNTTEIVECRSVGNPEEVLTQARRARKIVALGRPFAWLRRRRPGWLLGHVFVGILKAEIQRAMGSGVTTKQQRPILARGRRGAFTRTYTCTAQHTSSLLKYSEELMTTHLARVTNAFACSSKRRSPRSKRAWPVSRSIPIAQSIDSSHSEVVKQSPLLSCLISKPMCRSDLRRSFPSFVLVHYCVLLA